MLTLHILSMVFVLGVVFTADKEALAWLRGKRQTLGRRRLYLYHTLTWAGLAVLVGTGLKLFWPIRGYLLGEPLFIMKLLFVGILLVNAALIGRLMHVALNKPFGELGWAERLPLLTSGAVSSLSWMGAIVLAFVLFG